MYWRDELLLSSQTSIVVQTFSTLAGIFHFLLSCQQGRLLVLYQCHAPAPLTYLPFIARLCLPVQTSKSMQHCGVPKSYDVQYFCLFLHYFWKSEILCSINNSELRNALSPPVPLSGKIEVVVAADLILSSYKNHSVLFVLYICMVNSSWPGSAMQSLSVAYTAPVIREEGISFIYTTEF